MDRNDQVRKEPTLADLDAFEKLLRESLQAEPVKEPVLAQPAAPALPHNADQAAMAELARLVETPIEFETPLRAPVTPTVLEAHAPEVPAPESRAPEIHETEARAQEPYASEAHASEIHLAVHHRYAPSESEIADAAAHAHNHHTHGSVEAALAPAWNASPVVEAHYTPHHVAEQPPVSVAPATSLDPLAAFEEELRRFDAIRVSEQTIAPVAAEVMPAAPAAEPFAATRYEHEYAAPPARPQSVEAGWYQEPVATHPDYAAESRAESSLNAAEERLAAEAAAAAASAGATRGSGRSKGVFLALGGIAVAGLAVIGGSFVFGSGKKGGGSGDVPMIAARTEPTKEKPADPGGIEIPNLNKQVLAARNTPETRPAAVVNTTEQPLDLNQVTKRDSVRVIAPSPYQSSQPAGGTQTTLESPTPAAAVEPRRVTSVRIPIGGSETPPAAAPPSVPSLAAPAIGAAAAGAAIAGASARNSTAPASAAGQAAAPKVETRPVTAAQPRPETPKVAPPPKVATAPATTAPKATPPKNGPLSLNPPATAPARTASGGGGYAIQLASRPTESDAQSASSQLKGRYSSTLGSRSPSVVSGEANGQTVYRVRVGGYSQADAVAACTKIKAAGGGCFVTKQ